MRYKIAISIPAIIATALFIFGVVSVIFYHLTVINGEFKISMAVTTIGVSLVGLFIIAAFAFTFLKRRIG